MDSSTKTCSSKEHKEINATCYCIECKVYMCKKCENFHSKLFDHRHCYSLDQKLEEIFTGFCKEPNHLERLEYFCKNHNILCCASCAVKIKGKQKGEHKDCDICFIEDIKEEKKNKLKENIKSLENLSQILNESINQLKIALEKINKDKEELKFHVQKIFTKIRNALNDREDELLIDIDKLFEKYFFNEDIIKEGEKLPNKINISLEKGKITDNDWLDENNLNSLINDCINIENNIKDINKIKENIKKCHNSNDLKIQFYPKDESEINKFIESIKTFGKISQIIPINSKIINVGDNKLICDWIPNKSIINFSLLYRMSEDGPAFSTFHQKCDNQYPVLFLAKAKNGCKFGGYTSIGWNTISNNYISDEKSFLFSLNKNKKYKLLDNYKNYKTIGCYNNRGVDFNNDCYFYQNDMTKCYSSGNYAYLDGIGRVLADNNNNTTFIVEEVEIYKIIIQD